MEVSHSAPGSSWAWALVFVAALYLLTTPGTWMGGDHAEIILMSHRLVERGTFTLSPEGQTAPELFWHPRGRPRFFPGAAVALAPAVVVDHLFGWSAPPKLGRVVHLSGMAYVLCAFGLLGAAARRSGASPLATAVLVLFVGTSWPLWQIVRRGGAEPIVLFWIALFIWGSIARSAVARAAACIALPWTHPTGILLAATLAVVAPSASHEPSEPDAPLPGLAERVRYLLLALASAASVFLVWNRIYHGHGLEGGYANAPQRAWFLSPPLEVWTDYFLPQVVRLEPLLVTLSLGALALGRRGWRLLLCPLALFFVISGFFSIYSPTIGQDHVRRLAVVWPAFGLTLALLWESLQLTRAATAGLVVLNLLIGVYWFQLVDFDHYHGPADSYFPLVVWITWLRDGRSPLLCAAYVLALGIVLAVAGWRLCQLLPARRRPAAP
jgi:hypothetical protein